jgi:6-phosphogluconolactonase
MDQPPGEGWRLYLGTYTKRGGRGIQAAWFDPATGILSEPRLAAATANPTFLALSPNREVLYAVSEGPELALAYRIDRSSGALSALRPPGTGGPAPCHVSVDRTGRTVFVTNYHTAILAAIPAAADGSLGDPRIVVHRGSSVDPVRQTSAHVHSANVSPDNRFVIVCDLGQDRIFSYALDPVHSTLMPPEPSFVTTRPGAGPRHFAFGADGRHGYVVNEIDATLSVYAYDAAAGTLSLRQTVSTLPPDCAVPSTGAELRLHPNGRWLYASNRGHDSLALFSVEAGGSGELTPVDWVAAGGRNPRHFTLTPDGAWLVCCHQDSDTVGVFRVDPDSGRLQLQPGLISVSMPVCALFAP